MFMCYPTYVWIRLAATSIALTFLVISQNVRAWSSFRPHPSDSTYDHTDAWRFRSTSRVGVTLQSLLREKNTLESMVDDTREIYQTITEAFNLATTLRKKIIGSQASGKRILNTLLADRVALRQQQAEELQRIQQILYRLRRRKTHDPFSEVKDPLLDFPYRWVQVDGPGDKAAPGLNSHARWTYQSVALEPTELHLNVRPFNDRSKVTTVITQTDTTLGQETETKGNPKSMLLVRGRDFADGYIVAELSLQTASNAVSNPGSAAGFVFKFQNDKEFGFVTLSDTPLKSSSGTATGPHLMLGRMNAGSVATFTPIPVKVDLKKWSLIGLKFSPKTISVFINGILVHKAAMQSPWADGGAVGLHAALSSAAFRNFVAGPSGFESFCGEAITHALGTTFSDKTVLTRPFTPEEYQAFLSRAVEPVKSESSTRKPEEQPASNTKPMCYDYDKEKPSLSDWNHSGALDWAVVQDTASRRDRLTLASSTKKTNGHALFLENFACNRASVSARLLLEPESQGGLIIDNKGEDDRWLATIDSGFGILQLTHIKNGVPTVVGVEALPTLQDSELHKLDVKVTTAMGSRQYQVWFNEKCILTRDAAEGTVPDSFEKRQSDLRNNEGGGYGIWIGRGNVEFTDFTVYDAEPYAEQKL